MPTLRASIDSTGGRKGADEFRRSADDIKRKARETTTAVGKIKGSFDRLRRSAFSLRGAVAGVGLVLAIRAITQATIRQEDAVSQLEATLRSTSGAAGLTSDELTKMASGLQKITTFGDEAIIEMESLLLTFTRIGRDIFPRATESILDVATKMRTDLKSAALQVGKALNDPVGGMDALSRSGIQFTDTQKDVIKEFVETGRVAEAQLVILKELETQFGGSARAARETFGGALESLRNAFGDLLEQDALTGTRIEIENLTRALETDEVRRFADQLGTGLAAAARNAAGGLALAVRHMDALVVAGTAFVGLRLGAHFGPWGAAIGTAAGALLGLSLRSSEAERAIDAVTDAADRQVSALRRSQAATRDEAEEIRRAASEMLRNLDVRLESLRAAEREQARELERLARPDITSPELLPFEVSRTSGALDLIREDIRKTEGAIGSLREELAKPLPPLGRGAVVGEALPGKGPQDDFMPFLSRVVREQRAALEDEREAALRFIDEQRRAFLAATNQDIALIELRRDKFLSAVETMRLTEAEKAQARVDINAVAEAEIAEINRRRADEFRATLEDMNRDTVQAVRDVSNAISTEFEDALLGAQSLIDVLESLEQTLLRILLRTQVTKRLERGLEDFLSGFDFFGLLGGGNVISGGTGSDLISDIGADVLHGGGLVGAASNARRAVPVEAFANAPRYQFGLGLDEFPAILHRGEAVIPAPVVRAIRGGEGGPSLVINGPLVSVNARDVGSFRGSEDQIAAEMGRAVTTAMRRLG